MIQIITSHPVPLKNFLNNFSGFFSKRLFISFCFYFAGLFVDMKRTNISSISNKIPDSHYQNLQYFISEAKWNPVSINNHRLALLNSNSATKATSRGIIIIDDTGCKKWGQHFQGVANQYYGTENIITNSHNIVFSSYCDEKKAYPINFFPYFVEKDPLCISGEKIFKSKITLADELVDDVIVKEIPHCDVIFDNWYFASDLIYLLNLKGQHWISEAESNRLISYKGKWTKADGLRWKIECIFRDLKDNLAFDHYQVRSIDAITKHWFICVLAHSFLLWGKATGSLQHSSKRSIKNLSDTLKTLRSLNSIESLNWIFNHRTVYADHLGLIQLAA